MVCLLVVRIYPVSMPRVVGPSWMIRKENEKGWPCRVGEVKGNRENGIFLACNCLGEVRGEAGSMTTAVRFVKLSCKGRPLAPF